VGLKAEGKEQYISGQRTGISAEIKDKENKKALIPFAAQRFFALSGSGPGQELWP